MSVPRRSFALAFGTAVLFGTAALIPQHAAAQPTGSYPNRPIKIIVPLTAGGPTDLLARIVAEPLAKRLGQAVVVDNRPGAGGNIGAAAAAKSPPDGYTLLLGTSGPLSINAALYDNMTYDPARDFAPIIAIATAPFLVVISPNVSAGSLSDLVALAKKSPGKLNEGSVTGSAAHLASELFKSIAGLAIPHIPYKGAAPATNDLLAGQIDLSFASTPGVGPFVKTGKLRALAVTGPKRLPVFPNVSTIAESGFVGFDASVWYGLVAPAGTPKEIIEKLNAEISQVLKDPAIRQQMAANDFYATGSTADEFGAFIKSETLKWGQVVKTRGIKAE